MRQKIHQQARVAPAWIAHDHAKEMWEISAILEELPELPRLFGAHRGGCTAGKPFWSPKNVALWKALRRLRALG